MTTKRLCACRNHDCRNWIGLPGDVISDSFRREIFMKTSTRLAPTVVRSAASLSLAVATLLIAACAKQEDQQLQWARAALERNPDIEIVAADEHNGVFTVRDRDSGDMQAVSVNELAAVPLADLMKPKAAAAADAPRSTPAAPASTAAPTAAPAVTEATPSPAQSVAQTAPQSDTLPAQQSAESDNKAYTIERTGGQLRISGPGISVVSSGTTAAAATDSPTQRTVEPFICEGPRMMHLDNRSIYVDGDAIVARGGCELYITNSRVAAAGTGVVVHDAVVHISNSEIEGATASFAADSGARMFLRGSTFQGVPRRAESASVQDQGGNVWR
jgi:hypothetical protein